MKVRIEFREKIQELKNEFAEWSIYRIGKELTDETLLIDHSGKFVRGSNSIKPWYAWFLVRDPFSVTLDFQLAQSVLLLVQMLVSQLLWLAVAGSLFGS